MAEGPEVEIYVRDLRQAAVGRTVTAVEVLLPDAVRFPEPAPFAAQLTGRTVLDSQRRGKYMLLPLSGDLTLALHLMLWGTLRLWPANTPRRDSTLMVFGLSGDEEIHFRDTLGFARAALGTADELIERLDLASLGPDALDPAFSVAQLAEQLAGRRGVLKSTLLNPRIIAGLGNRDSDESMWLARIDPRRKANTLNQPEIVRLHAAIRQVLDEGLALRGTQRDLFGVQGQAKHQRYIFERSGQPCPRCGTRIGYIKLGGRNTFFCPRCQQ